MPNGSSFWRSAVRLLSLLPTVVLASCFSLHMSESLDRFEYIDPERKNTTLIVFLPGIYDHAADFEREGLVKAVRDRGLHADMIAVEAHFGYYLSGNVVDHLRTEVIAPARDRGYRDIWLVGISLGGFGSLLFSKTYPEEVKGAFLISPFLGLPASRMDPAEWLQSRQAQPGDEGLWEWLTEYSAEKKSTPALFLGYGEQDKFADASGRLSKYLAHDNVIHMPGTHDWPTWKALWERALDKNLLALPSPAATTPRAQSPLSQPVNSLGKYQPVSTTPVHPATTVPPER